MTPTRASTSLRSAANTSKLKVGSAKFKYNGGGNFIQTTNKTYSTTIIVLLVLLVLLVVVASMHAK